MQPGWPSTSGRSTTRSDLRAMVALGVDTVITDDVTLALPVLDPPDRSSAPVASDR